MDKAQKLATFLVALSPMFAAQAEDLSSYGPAELYGRLCASCHGEKGTGDGPVAPFFKLAPPDLTRIAKRHGGEFPAEKIRRIIDGTDPRDAHGKREMPVWGYELMAADDGSQRSREEAERIVAQLVEYLRSIQVK